MDFAFRKELAGIARKSARTAAEHAAEVAEAEGKVASDSVRVRLALLSGKYTSEAEYLLAVARGLEPVQMSTGGRRVRFRGNGRK